MNIIKRAYSREVVQDAAEQFGWQLTETAENEYQVERESY